VSCCQARARSKYVQCLPGADNSTSASEQLWETMSVWMHVILAVSHGGSLHSTVRRTPFKRSRFANFSVLTFPFREQIESTH
jgi:hypothetical protein